MNVKPGWSKRVDGGKYLIHVEFDRCALDHVFAQIKKRRADAMSFNQTRGRGERCLHISAADETRCKRASFTGASHEARNARAARQRDHRILHDAHGVDPIEMPFAVARPVDVRTGE